MSAATWAGRARARGVDSRPDDGDERVVDLDAAEDAAAAFLVALGVDVTTAGTLETPRRMAQAYAELLTPAGFDVTTFPNDDAYGELVLVREIPVRSVCEHHMLPFGGVAHVGYLPGTRIVGLSKLARLVAHAAARPQTQERLTRQVAERLAGALDTRGVGVVVVAEHSCMSLRGARATGATTRTSTLLGDLRTDRALRDEFLAAVAEPAPRR
ncbi:GTP cyclohydrolase I [Cellulomonas alba]|uniref:GTP cyclohydrolase 1 n=1 Tax=Cellulomonas alba TaxID=3053467 RepID=A0ABT7SD68_9CELL|nr:GTP cyclohydrolase I [Cellulomonas alba]MDM7854143.1 GTP cyclohydrolase I [Cellulomonas alba]